MADRPTGFRGAALRDVRDTVHDYKNRTRGNLTPTPGRDLAFDQPGIRFRNESGETIPAYGAVRLGQSVGIDPKRKELEGLLPADFGARLDIWINSREPVDDGRYGFCPLTPLVWAAYSPGEDSDNPIVPQPGEAWGPLEDSGVLHQHVGGFRVMAVDTINEIILVMRQPLYQMEASLDETLSSGGTAQATPVYWQGSAWQRHDDETIVIHDARGLGGIANAGAIVNVYWEQTLGGWVGVSRGCKFAASS